MQPNQTEGQGINTRLILYKAVLQIRRFRFIA